MGFRVHFPDSKAVDKDVVTRTDAIQLAYDSADKMTSEAYEGDVLLARYEKRDVPLHTKGGQ